MSRLAAGTLAGMLPMGDPLVRSVLLIRLVKIAHWLICLQQRVIDGAKAVEAFLIELR